MTFDQFRDLILDEIEYFFYCQDGPGYYDDDGLTDVEADSMTLASAGWGTDEDYGCYGDDGADW